MQQKAKSLRLFCQQPATYKYLRIPINENKFVLAAIDIKELLRCDASYIIIQLAWKAFNELLNAKIEECADMNQLHLLQKAGLQIIDEKCNRKILGLAALPVVLAMLFIIKNLSALNISSMMCCAMAGVLISSSILLIAPDQLCPSESQADAAIKRTVNAREVLEKFGLTDQFFYRMNEYKTYLSLA